MIMTPYTQYTQTMGEGEEEKITSIGRNSLQEEVVAALQVSQDVMAVEAEAEVEEVVVVVEEVLQVSRVGEEEEAPIDMGVAAEEEVVEATPYFRHETQNR